MRHTLVRDRKVATFSIVACSKTENSLGVAVASKYLAVGAIVPYAWSNVGSIAIQSIPNVSYPESAFRLLSQGHDAPTTLAKLIELDPEPGERQVGIVDKNGVAASFTGKDCSSWAGGILGNGYAAQGNMLGSSSIISTMGEAFESAEGELADRLYKALLAGDRAGGDKRGKQSAALLVVRPMERYGGYTDRYVDLRVDNHPEPVEELGLLLQLHHVYLGLTSLEDKIKIDEGLATEFQVLLRSLGFYHGELTGRWDTLTQQAFSLFIDRENLEERVDIKNALIDPPALEYLREHFM